MVAKLEQWRTFDSADRQAALDLPYREIKLRPQGPGRRYYAELVPDAVGLLVQEQGCGQWRATGFLDPYEG
jgi:hypothetical protein